MTKLIYTQDYKGTKIVTSAMLTYDELKSIYDKDELNTLRRGLQIVREYPHMTFTVQRG